MKSFVFAKSVIVWSVVGTYGFLLLKRTYLSVYTRIAFVSLLTMCYPIPLELFVIPALGRQFEVGSLYNARNDKIMPGR